MLYRREIGGPILKRPGGGLANSSNCCCLCECLGDSATVEIPAFTLDPEYVGGLCPGGCENPSRTVVLTLKARGTVTAGEPAVPSYDYCVFEAIVASVEGDECYFARYELTIRTTGAYAGWGDNIGILAGLMIYDADDNVVGLFTASKNCGELTLPGNLELEPDPGGPCVAGGNALLPLPALGCCPNCVACNSFLSGGGPRPNITVTIEPLTDGPDPNSCTLCEDFFGEFSVPYDAAKSDDFGASRCVYYLPLDPEPDPSQFCSWDPLDVPTWEAKCSAYAILVTLLPYMIGPDKKTDISIRITSLIKCDPDPPVEAAVLAWWTATVDGWSGEFSVAPDAVANVPGSTVCDTATDAVIVIPCVAPPPEEEPP